MMPIINKHCCVSLLHFSLHTNIIYMNSTSERERNAQKKHFAYKITTCSRRYNAPEQWPKMTNINSKITKGNTFRFFHSLLLLHSFSLFLFFSHSHAVLFAILALNDTQTQCSSILWDRVHAVLFTLIFPCSVFHISLRCVKITHNKEKRCFGFRLRNHNES